MIWKCPKGPAYPLGKRVFALWGNDGGRSDCFWAESNGVFSPCAGLKPSHRWSCWASQCCTDFRNRTWSIDDPLNPRNHLVRTVFVLFGIINVGEAYLMIFAFSALQYPQAPSLGSSCVITVWPVMIWLGPFLQFDGNGRPVPVTQGVVKERLICE